MSCVFRAHYPLNLKFIKRVSQTISNLFTECIASVKPSEERKEDDGIIKNSFLQPAEQIITGGDIHGCCPFGFCVDLTCAFRKILQACWKTKHRIVCRLIQVLFAGQDV